MESRRDQKLGRGPNVGLPDADPIRHGGGVSAFRLGQVKVMKSNSYLTTKVDGTSEETLADHYEREGDAWVFMIGTTEVLRMRIDEIASITEAGRGT